MTTYSKEMVPTPNFIILKSLEFEFTKEFYT